MLIEYLEQHTALGSRAHPSMMPTARQNQSLMHQEHLLLKLKALYYYNGDDVASHLETTC